MVGIHCGTVHKFQGREADIVFLVLGSNPSNAGAREWASSQPNLLNVAVTRAKKRLYVIGNKTLWGNLNYFNVLCEALS
jgi:superfamily I DNA and/or RNA helicase